ncbi:hypothetical protein JXB28_00660 [Candidatus Woesearchaeota archaeon]|nr:hypothetical protein [Candidatus Woesearchaeota archaeon]
MASISWCKKQRKGIRLIEPNENLAKEYLETAQETLETLKSIRNKSKVWLATTKYYCEYFAIYSLLMKLGIKSEIHECTIAVCAVLEELGIVPKGYSQKLEQDKQLRIDNQYYLKNKEVPVNYDELLQFVLTIKDITSKLTQEEARNARERIRKG